MEETDGLGEGALRKIEAADEGINAFLLRTFQPDLEKRVSLHETSHSKLRKYCSR